MRGRAITLLAITLLLAVATCASAEEWIVLGSRARGMGGAGVAGGRHPYWNPAFAGGEKLISFKNIEARIPFGLEISTQGNIIAEVDDVYDLMNEFGFDTIATNLNTGTGSITDIQTAILLVKELKDLESRGQGLYATLGYGASFRLGENLGVYWNSLGYGGVDLMFDLGPFTALADGGFTELFNTTGTTDSPTTPEGIAFRDTILTQFGPSGLTAAQADQFAALAEQTTAILLDDPDTVDALIKTVEATLAGGATPEDTIYNNKSGVRFSILMIHEVGFNLSGSFLKGLVSMGVGIKVLTGVGFEREFFVKDAIEEDSLEKFFNIPDDWTGYAETWLTPKDALNDVSVKTTYTFGIDAGVIVRPLKMLTLAVCAKNLNMPSFELPSGKEITLETQVRVGAELKLKMLRVAMDYDLLKSASTVLPGFYSQLVSLGVEFAPVDSKLFGFMIRAGGYKNIAEDRDDLIVSAGVGLRIFVVELDVAASMSTDTVTWIGKQTQNLDVTDPNWRELTESIPERVSLSISLGAVFKIG